ncbi:hypothetical protein ABW19_dt0201654 [Dactylella cylindrospora]|nr:hypothetical protein ABW19_dt0201654 [Dactylella cylindrospora]
MVKIQLLSDLHLESPSAYDTFAITPTAPYLALLGDIGNVRDPGFFPFLRTIIPLYTTVFFVPGNHEPYHSDWETTNSKLSAFEKDINSEADKEGRETGRFVLLTQRRYDITDEITILGCTLFSAINPANIEDVSFGINDFYHISSWTVTSHSASHVSDLSFLNSTVASISSTSPRRKIIIFTHYAPTLEGSNPDPKYRNSKISSGFASDLTGEECWRSENVKVWGFGHTHYNVDFVEEGTGKRVVANQRGYYFRQAEGFDGEKVVEV